LQNAKLCRLLSVRSKRGYTVGLIIARRNDTPPVRSDGVGTKSPRVQDIYHQQPLVTCLTSLRRRCMHTEVSVPHFAVKNAKLNVLSHGSDIQYSTFAESPRCALAHNVTWAITEKVTAERMAHMFKWKCATPHASMTVSFCTPTCQQSSSTHLQANTRRAYTDMLLFLSCTKANIFYSTLALVLP